MQTFESIIETLNRYFGKKLTAIFILIIAIYAFERLGESFGRFLYYISH